MPVKRYFGIEKFKGLLLAASFATVVEFLMGVSDSAVAGNLLGEQALASINLLSSVMGVVTFFASLIGVGMGVNYALESGRCAPDRARQIFTQGLWTALGVGLMLVTALIFLREPFLAFMSPSPEIAEYARRYWRFFVPSALLEPCVILLVNVAMADGNSCLCFISYAAQLVVNLAVSLLAIRDLGVAGCALGTVVANAVAAGVLSTHFLSKANSFALVRHFSLKDTGRIVSSSFGDASSFLCSAALFFFLNKFVISRYGSGMLPVLATVIVTIGLLEIFNGVGNALAPIVTVYSGERNYPAIRLMMRMGTKLALLEGAALSALLLAFPGLVVRLVGIDDPALAGDAHAAVRFVAAGLVAYSLAYLYNSYYVFVGHEGLSVAVTVLNGFVVPVGLVLLCGGRGAYGLWAALAAAPVAALVLFGAFLLLRHGAARFPLLLPRDRDAKISMVDLALNDEEIVRASEQVGEVLKAAGVKPTVAMRASLMTEEVFMAVKDRNGARRVLGEVTLDLNDGVQLTLRDDGEIFDITDADQKISSLRTYLVASVMETQAGRMNIVTTGFNRNVFRF